MTPSRMIAIVAAIAILGLLTGLGVRSLLANKNDASAYVKQNTDLNVPINSSQFAWGITVLTFPFPTYNESFTGAQVAEAAKLGLNYIRVDYVPSNPEAAEVAVNEARKNGLKVVLVIPFGPKDIFTNPNLATDTDVYVTDIVKRFKGKVAVYQLATEAASVALHNAPGKHGIEVKDYPTNDLEAVTTWVKAASEAVKKTDRSAKRLVNDQWVHTGFFDNYFAQGGDFDILGWNWFSDMGTTMDTAVLDARQNQTYNLMDKLKSYNKPIWLTEVNRRLGSQEGKEQEQAGFITTMINYTKTQPAIKGFFVFNLLEDQVAPIQERGYSIITATADGKNQKITGRKPAFDAYKQAIENFD